MSVNNPDRAVVGQKSANRPQDVYTIKGWSTVTNDAISPKIELPTKKGKLVFFQHGLGADWREFATTISGTSPGHESWDSLKDPLQKKKYGSKKEVSGLVQVDSNTFWDAGVISQRGSDFSSKEDKSCSHDCQLLQKKKIAEMLQKGKIVCIKTEFSSGVLHFSAQFAAMGDMVYEVELLLANKEIDYDVAFVGHSMGGLASINYGIDYAKRVFETKSTRKVDIITVGTPYYENTLAAIEQDWTKNGLDGRGKEGAQLDLAGYTDAMYKLRNDWNKHITSVEGQNTTLGAIAVQAEGYDGQHKRLADNRKEMQQLLGVIEKEKEEELHDPSPDTARPSRNQESSEQKYERLKNECEDIERQIYSDRGLVGSDCIVPFNVQQGIMPYSLKLEEEKMRERIRKEGEGAIRQEALKKIDSLTNIKEEKEKSKEYSESMLKTLFILSGEERQQHERNIDSCKQMIKECEDGIKKANGTIAKLPYYSDKDFVAYQKVHILSKISNPKYEPSINLLYTKHDYHHVNTCDLPEVISSLSDALKGWIH